MPPKSEPNRPDSSDLPDDGAAGSTTDSRESPIEPETEPELPREPRRVVPSRVSLIVVAILAAGAIFAGGFTLGSHVASTPGTPSSEEQRFQAFWDVYQLIQNDFAGQNRPTADQLVQGAIKGMLEALNDQWSYYQAPADFQNSLLSVGGQAVGIGVQVQLQPVVASSTTTSCTTIGTDCEMAITKVYDGAPAQKAGLQTADVIESVNGTSLAGKSVDDATKLIRGDKDTPVTLGISRAGETFTVTIVRQPFDLPEVESRSLDNGAVEYISISGINPPASSQFDLALATAIKAGVKSYVLDLRGNPGGYVPDAQKIASEFIGTGAIAYQQDAHGTESEISAQPGGRAVDPSIHLVVLVDGNTASAAEIVAGALQARGRAVLVGAKTYGKGVAQEWLPLPNNYGGIHLTTARWLTPNHVWINGKGLQPDVPATNDGARAGTDPILDAGLEKLGYAALPAPSEAPSAGPSSSASPAPSSSSPAPSPVGPPVPVPSPSGS